MQDENKANFSEKDGSSRTPKLPISESGDTLEQKIHRKRYVFSAINKRTYGLVALALLIAIALVLVLVQQRKLLVLKKSWRTEEKSETVTTSVFDNYKTILSVSSFEMLADKFKRRNGTFSLESNPMKDHIEITYDSSIISKAEITKVLYTKAKLPVSYPTCMQNELICLRLRISNYYDSFDGLLVRNMLAGIKGVYYLESGFDGAPYLDLTVNARVDVVAVVNTIQGRKAHLYTKGIKEFNVNYKVETYSIIAECKPIEFVRRKVLPVINVYSPKVITGKVDSILLFVDKNDIVRGGKLRRLLSDSGVSSLSILSFETIADSLPLVKIRFISDSKTGKESILNELNKSNLTFKSKYGHNEIENTFHFKPHKF
jgi:hypothetical protein